MDACSNAVSAASVASPRSSRAFPLVSTCPGSMDMDAGALFSASLVARVRALRAEGLTFPSIAGQTGLSTDQARDAVLFGQGVTDCQAEVFRLRALLAHEQDRTALMGAENRRLRDKLHRAQEDATEARLIAAVHRRVAATWKAAASRWRLLARHRAATLRERAARK